MKVLAFSPTGPGVLHVYAPDGKLSPHWRVAEPLSWRSRLAFNPGWDTVVISESLRVRTFHLNWWKFGAESWDDAVMNDWARWGGALQVDQWRRRDPRFWFDIPIYVEVAR